MKLLRWPRWPKWDDGEDCEAEDDWDIWFVRDDQDDWVCRFLGKNAFQNQTIKGWGKSL